MKVRVLAERGDIGDDESGRGERELQFYVKGELNDATVLTAVDSDDPEIKIPARGAIHPDDDPESPTHFCVDRKARWFSIDDSGEDSYIVTCKFRTPAAGGGSGDYDIALKYEWDIGTDPKSTVADVDGNPIVNANGEPYDGDFSDVGKVLILRVYAQELGINPDEMFSIVDRVNSHKMKVFGKTVGKRQMRCDSYRPPGRMVVGRNLLQENEYVFEFKPGYRPWDIHAANVGFTSYIIPKEGESAIRGPIVSGELDSPLEAPTMLKPDGTPVDESLKAGLGLSGRVFKRQTPVANPNIDTISAPDGDNPDRTGWMEFRAAPGGGYEAVARGKEEYNFIGLFPFFEAAPD